MGCVFSKAVDDGNPTTFHVWNVDERGNNVNPGKIEVTQSDLILRQKGKQDIRWPLRSLRRYGFDAELFSFESGRRCPTGPGIYAFKCRRAELLFNVLQECIQNSGGIQGTVGSPTFEDRSGDVSANVTMANGSVPNGSIPSDPTYLEPIRAQHRCSLISSTDTLSGISPGRGGVTTPAEMPPHYMNEEVFSVSRGHRYVNSFVLAEEYSPATEPVEIVDLRRPVARSPCECVDQNTNYARLDELLKQEHSAKHRQRFYVNVGPEAAVTAKSPPPATLVSPNQPKSPTVHFYQQQPNLDPESGGEEEPRVNYIVLDLNQKAESEPAPPTGLMLPCYSVTEGYATIDFDRTAALSISANSCLSNDDGMRKTRHNGAVPL